MRFRTRAFLICFVPFALLLSGSFWMIQRFVQSTVRDRMFASLRENQIAIAQIHAKSDLQNSRFLKVAGENPRSRLECSCSAPSQAVKPPAGQSKISCVSSASIWGSISFSSPRPMARPSPG